MNGRMDSLTARVKAIHQKFDAAYEEVKTGVYTRARQILGAERLSKIGANLS